MNFKEFIQLSEQNSIGYHNDGQGSFQRTGGVYLSSDQTGSEGIEQMTGHPLHLPSLDMAIPNDIPKMTRTAEVRVVDRNKNPIFVYLSDGTRLYFTLDEFKRIPGGEPAPGKKVTVTFQRNQKTNSASPSQIHSIRVV